MTLEDVDLTPTQQRMLTLLSDERPHNRFALKKCLRDAEMGSLQGIKMHLSMLRKKIEPHHYGIQCEMLAGESYYRLVHLATVRAE